MLSSFTLIGVFSSTHVEKENASVDKEPPGAIALFPLSKGGGVLKGFVGVVGNCSGKSAYSLGLWKRLLDSVGYL